MMTSQEVLSVYEAMLLITGQMVLASQHSDWDQLIALEQRCAAHVQHLKLSEPPLALQGEKRAKKIEIIRKMLDDDRKIRDLTMPRVAQLSALMHSVGAERRLVNAYGNT